MADLPGGATGGFGDDGSGGGFSGGRERGFSIGGKRIISMGSKFNFDIPGLKDTTKEIRDLRVELEGLDKAAQSLGRSMPKAAAGVGSLHQGSPGTPSGNSSVFAPLGQVFAGNHVGGGVGGVGGATAPAFAPSQNGNPSFGLEGFGQGFAGGSGLGGIITTLGNLLLQPIKLAYNRIEENRASSLTMAKYLGPAASRGGNAGIEDLIKTLVEHQPVRGSLNDQMEAIRIGSQAGYTISPNTQGRSGGFYESVRQLQQLNPGSSAGSIAGSLSGFTGNASAAQTSVMLSGGAFSFQAAGGRMKSFSDWADGLLRFFQNQRPGAAKGRAFTQEELESQQFQGSNFQAWFSINQVPADLQDAFWQYVISKSRPGTSADFNALIGETRGPDLAFQRLQGLSAQAKRDYALTSSSGVLGAGVSMYQQYQMREKADTSFQGTLANTFDTALGKIGGSFGGLIPNIPSPIADILYQFLMQGPAIVGGAVSSIPMVGGSAGPPAATGDVRGHARPRRSSVMVGDTSGYGQLGGSTTSGLAPGLAQGIAAMMAENPNLQINSGLRDGGTQYRLGRDGIGYMAGVGQSEHARGWAADLGPDSEHGWIAANAGRFGLANAANVGEPWHVGLPGTVPVFGDVKARPPRGGAQIGNPLSGIPIIGPAIDGIGSAISGVAGGVGNIGSAIFGGLWDVLQFAGSMGGGIMDLFKGDLSGLFGQGGPLDPSALGNSVMNGLLSLMGLDGILDGGAGATNKLLGRITSGNQKVSKGSNLVMGQTVGGMFGNAIGNGVDIAKGAFSQGPVVATSAQNILSISGLPSGVPAASIPSGSQMQAIAALQAAQKQGLSGGPLVMAGAIAGKESTFNPMAHAVGPKDDSYGLWQINMLGTLGPDRRKKYGLASNEQLFDRDTNAKAMATMSGGGKQWNDWYVTGPKANADEKRKTAAYVPPVYDLAKKAGMVGDVRGGVRHAGSPSMYQSFSPTSNVGIGGSTYQITIPITIQSSGRGGQGDARVLARQIASALDDEVSKLQETHS